MFVHKFTVPLTYIQSTIYIPVEVLAMIYKSALLTEIREVKTRLPTTRPVLKRGQNVKMQLVYLGITLLTCYAPTSFGETIFIYSTISYVHRIVN